MPAIDILVDNCGGKNKNNAIIRFLNMINEGVLFGIYNLYLYIQVHTKNDRDHTFNSLKVMYRKQNFITFDKCCGILNTINNV